MMRYLTIMGKNDIVSVDGELSERFKELVLKTSDSERNLGFESLTLRQKSTSFERSLSIFTFHYYLFTLHFSLKYKDFLEVISKK